MAKTDVRPTEIRNADLIEIHAGVRLNFKSNCKMPNKLIAVNVFKSRLIWPVQQNRTHYNF